MTSVSRNGTVARPAAVRRAGHEEKSMGIDGGTVARDADAVIERKLAALGLRRKVELLTGARFWSTAGAQEIGLRPVLLSDGPAGGRGETWDERVPSVHLPAPMACAATWDEPLVTRLAELLAVEARRQGVD